MKNAVPDYTIILAAGKGLRMGKAACPKVCVKINGEPAVNRVISAYEKSGIRQHIVVVGDRAAEVMATVTPRFPNVVYAYQPQQSGTANALRCALEALAIPDDADLLVAAGDRIAAPAVLKQLYENYAASGSQLALPALHCTPDSTLGRICTDDDGLPAAVIEWDDIRQRRAIRMLRKMLLGDCVPDRRGLYEILCENFFGFNGKIRPEEAERALGKLWNLLYQEGDPQTEELLALLPEEKCEFRIGCGDNLRKLSPSGAASLPYGNASIYLARCSLLREACANISRDNARQEEYLSDLIAFAYGRKEETHPLLLPVDSPRLLAGFNNPAELQEVEHLLQSEKSPEPPEPDRAVFRPLSQWLGRQKTPEWMKTLCSLYGSDAETAERQRKALQTLLARTEKTLPADAPVAVFRSPGRLNLMGRNIDHQGGSCNLMTVGFEHLLAVHPRKDDHVVLHHVDEAHFAPAEFSIKAMVATLPWETWQKEQGSRRVLSRQNEDDWTEYIRESLLRLQKQFPDQPLYGMDVFVGGDLPMAAGLSSQSALAAGIADAAVAVNRLDAFPSQFVALCGDSEFAAGNAGIRLGGSGSVTQVRFFNFAVERSIPFPEAYSMLVCDSGVHTGEMWENRSQFNRSRSCFQIGFQLIRKAFPQYCGVLEHLRDVNVKNLQMPLSGIYRLLLALPENPSYGELLELLPEENLKALCAGHPHTRNTRYPIRGAVMYCLCECSRADLCSKLLQEGRIEELGTLMKLSHDGVRMIRRNADGAWTPWHASVDNNRLLRLLEDLESGDPERVIRAQTANQPGCCVCSSPEIDRMVDICCAVPGVAGAQLAGSGLGGYMMVLAKNEAIESVREELTRKYYAPEKITPRILICRPISGAGAMPVLD